MAVEPKALWTDADFDQMGWHDSRVHAISFDPDSPEVPGSVALDLDYIFEWVHPLDRGGPFSFWVAPATLVFPGASDLTLTATLDGYMTLEIDAITRRLAEGRRGGPGGFRWSIQGSFELEVTASRYQQYVRAAPRHAERQSLTLEERGGASFATTGHC